MALFLTELCSSQLQNSLQMSESETSSSKQWRKSNLFLEIPTRTLEVSRQEFKITPPTPTPTPKRVNFVLTPSPSDARLNQSSRPSSTRPKSSLRNILPKLNFNNRPSNNSDTDNKPAFNIDSAVSSTSISRSWSFSKIFTPRSMKRAASLPVTPITNSNPNSVRDGSSVS